MADIADQQSVLHQGTNINGSSEILTISAPNVVVGGDMSSDLLQQALDEVAGNFEQNNVTYASENLADGSLAIPVSVNVDNGTGEVVTTLVGDSDHCLEDTNTYTYVMADQSSVAMGSETIAVGDGHTQLVNCDQIVDQQQNEQGFVTENIQMPSLEEHENQVQLIPSEPAVQETADENLAPVQEPDVVPLGTSANPIRIIQQGNQYTSLQQLTPEQLSQIMQVVQQQQLLKSTKEQGGSSVIYNPQTQTRIVYKVIYPSELHGKTEAKNVTASSGSSSGGQRQVQVPTSSVTVMTGPMKRTYRKRKHQDDLDKSDTPLSREERDARKKRKLRTRSGRVSRPPRHMIKDYKHIHPVDFNDEPYDDSDGGYSDFKQSDSERDDREKREKGENHHSPYNFGSSKPKNFKCEVCDKAYIGRAGLARHHRIYPEHDSSSGQIQPATEDQDDDNNPGEDYDTENSNSSLVNAHTIKPPPTDEQTDTPANNAESPTTDTPTPSFSGLFPSADSAEKSPAPTQTQTESTVDQVEATEPEIKVKPAAKREGPYHKLKANVKAKQAYIQEIAPNRRKQKLKDLMMQCSDEELMETVLPRLTRVITLWEFLLMKVEEADPPRVPPTHDMITQFSSLLKQVKKSAHDQLELCEEETEGEDQREKIELDNEEVCSCLGLAPGTYYVKPQTAPETDFQYKFMTANPKIAASNRRTVELVSPEKLVAPPVPDRRTLLPPSVNLEERAENGIRHIVDGDSGAADSDTAVNVVENGGQIVNGLDLVNGITVEVSKDADGTVKIEKCARQVGSVTVAEPVIGESESLPDSVDMSQAVALAQPMEVEHSVAVTQPITMAQNGSQSVVMAQNGCQSVGIAQSITVVQPETVTQPVTMAETVAVTQPVGLAQNLTLAQPINDSQPIFVTQPMSLSEPVGETEGVTQTVSLPQPVASSVSSLVVNNGSILKAAKEEGSVMILQADSQTADSQPASSLQHHVTTAADVKTKVLLKDSSNSGFLVRTTPYEEPQRRDQITSSQPMISLLNGNIVNQPQIELNGTASSPRKTVVMSQPAAVKEEQYFEHEVMVGEAGDGHNVGIPTLDQSQVYVTENPDVTDVLEEHAIDSNSEIYQTNDGLVLIRSPDGTIHIHGHTGNGIPMETVEALLAMAPNSQNAMETFQTVDNV